MLGRMRCACGNTFSQSQREEHIALIPIDITPPPFPVLPADLLCGILLFPGSGPTPPPAVEVLDDSELCVGEEGLSLCSDTVDS
jgi:hypothetical protein